MRWRLTKVPKRSLLEVDLEIMPILFGVYSIFYFNNKMMIIFCKFIK